MSKALTVAHVITRFIKGGADENTLLTCNGQVQRGYDVHLILGDEHDADMLGKLSPGVKVHIIRNLVRRVDPWRDLMCLADLWVVFGRVRPNIVHTHESKAGVIGRLAAFLSGVETVVHGVHILPFVGVSGVSAQVFLLLEQIVARFTHAFVDVSAGMRDLCIENGLGNSTNHFVVASGMDLARYRNAPPISGWRDGFPEVADNEYWKGREPRIALIAGTLEPRKRVLDLIRALLKYSPAGDWLLLVAGDGTQKAEILDFINTQGIGHRVVLMGHCDQLENYIHLADVCVHAATNEGLPRVVVQYVLGARPVVATHLPGIERVISDRRNGDLVSLADIEALAERLLDLLNDRERRAAYSAHAKQIDLSAWDSDEMINGIDEAYRFARRSRKGRAL